MSLLGDPQCCRGSRGGQTAWVMSGGEQWGRCSRTSRALTPQPRLQGLGGGAEAEGPHLPEFEPCWGSGVPPHVQGFFSTAGHRGAGELRPGPHLPRARPWAELGNRAAGLVVSVEGDTYCLMKPSVPIRGQRAPSQRPSVTR